MIKAEREVLGTNRRKYCYLAPPADFELQVGISSSPQPEAASIHTDFRLIHECFKMSSTPLNQKAFAYDQHDSTQNVIISKAWDDLGWRSSYYSAFGNEDDKDSLKH